MTQAALSYIFTGIGNWLFFLIVCRARILNLHRMNLGIDCTFDGGMTDIRTIRLYGDILTAFQYKSTRYMFGEPCMLLYEKERDYYPLETLPQCRKYDGKAWQFVIVG
jgi:hypothetical protein